MDPLSWIIGIGILVSSTVGAVALLKYTFAPRQRDGLIPPRNPQCRCALTSHGETEGWGIRPRDEEATDDEDNLQV